MTGTLNNSLWTHDKEADWQLFFIIDKISGVEAGDRRSYQLKYLQDAR